MHRQGDKSAFLLAVTVALTAACLLAPAAAPAKFQKAIWGNYELPASSSWCPGHKPCSPFPAYRRLGVEVVQVQIHWDEIAKRRPADPRNPHDPAYHWGEIARFIEEGEHKGFEMSAMLTRAPRWANRHSEPIWAPVRSEDFADFAFAASERFPAIRKWMIWGEWSRVENFRPLKPNHGHGARVYARILDDTYEALKEANPANIVIGGMTLNGGTLKPPQVIRYMRLPDGSPPRMDLWGTNPFDARFPRLADRPVGRFRGFNDIDTLHHEIAVDYRRAHLPVPKLWISEWTIVSDKPLGLFGGFFVSRREQARRLTTAFKIARRTGYVVGMGWFNMVDEVQEGEYAGWGLMDVKGNPKPSFYAYQRVP